MLIQQRGLFVLAKVEDVKRSCCRNQVLRLCSCGGGVGKEYAWTRLLDHVYLL